jgi:hypothetical protein
MVLGMHINSTAPFAMKHQGAAYCIENFELLSTILSALSWRKTNGSIKLYTDNRGHDYYASMGLLDLWDGGVDTSVIERIPESVNQHIFWAAAKIFALQNEAVPVALMDTDLIVWESLEAELASKAFAVLHREALMESIYIHGDYLKRREGYAFDPEWDWTTLPCNMAFAYFSDANFKKYYTDCAIDFMTGNGEYPMEMVSQMVFAEQRIVAMCAKKMNIPIHPFLDHPFQRDNNRFSHIWGGKDIARRDNRQRQMLCTALLRKIKERFPAYHEKLRDTEAYRHLLS